MDNVDLNLDDDDDDSIVGRNVESRNYHQYQSSQQPPNFQSPLNPVRRLFWSFWPLRLHQTLNITLGGRTCPRWKMSRFEKHYLFLESRKHSRLVSGSSGTLCSWWSPIKQLLVSWSHLFHRSLSCHSLITACHECIRKQNIEKLLVRGCGHICYIIFHTVTILAIQEACFDRWHASMWISILSQPDHQFQFVTSPFSFGVGVASGTSSAMSGRVNFDEKMILLDQPGELNSWILAFGPCFSSWVLYHNTLRKRRKFTDQFSLLPFLLKLRKNYLYPFWKNMFMVQQ